MATQRKRKALRASFVVTVTAAASALSFAALPGCGSTVSGSCPGEAPAYGSSCSDDRQVCGYGSDGCGNPLEYECEDGAWGYADPIATCNPPPPLECPSALPPQGDPCEPPWEGSCTYTVDTGCGPMEAQATCFEGSWQVVIPTCNPPPPDYCFTLTTEADCAANSSFCRWLVPGCADPGVPPPPLAQAGCFPSSDCAAGDVCPEGSLCQEVVYDPCYNLDCNACGAVARLCVGP